MADVHSASARSLKSFQLPDLPPWLGRNHLQHMSSALKQQYRQQIDDETRPLETRLLRLRADRNALAPISCLPIELLSRIFNFLVDWECEELLMKERELLRHRTISEKGPYRLKWLYSTHVCRSWRNVALNCPVLWRQPFFFKVDLASMMLARSGNAEIDIIASSFYTSPIRKQLQGLQLVPQHMHRVRRIELILSVSALDDLVSGCIGAPAPRLRYLSLSSHSGFRLSGRHWETRIPSNIFQGNTPNLRTLRLGGWAIDWNSSLLTTLTHLELRSVPHRWKASVGDILNGLSRLPLLERLGLSDASLKTTSDIPTEVVNLPRLRYLMIKDEVEPCTQLLDHLAVPAGIPLTICCNRYLGTPIPHDVAGFMQTISKHFTAKNDLPSLHTMRLSFQECKVGQVKIWRDPSRAYDQNRNTRATADLCLTFPNPIELSECHIHQLPLSEIQSLTLVAMQDPLREEVWPDGETDVLLRESWDEFLRVLTGLRVFKVVGTAVPMEELFASLVGPVNSPDGVRLLDEWKSVLPRLQEVGLHYVIIDPEAWEALSCLCTMRQRKGALLQSLVLQQCCTGEHPIRTGLSDTVQSLTWDDISLSVDETYSRFLEDKEWEYRPAPGQGFLENWVGNWEG